MRTDKLSMVGIRTFRAAKTIAIVGNGGVSSVDNEKIDRADCVIRFNNYATREGIEYTADRMRCDVLFSTFDLHSAEAQPLNVVIGIPFPFNAKAIQRKLNKWYPKSAPFMSNPFMVMDACKELGLDSLGHEQPMPSLGFSAIYQLKKTIESIASFNPEVFIAGFKWYSDPDKLIIQDRKLDLPKPSHFNHFYREEMQWVIRNIMDKPRWSFSVECFQILSTFAPYLK